MCAETVVFLTIEYSEVEKGVPKNPPTILDPYLALPYLRLTPNNFNIITTIILP
jgi:hypothetical protein